MPAAGSAAIVIEIAPFDDLEPVSRREISRFFREIRRYRAPGALAATEQPPQPIPRLRFRGPSVP